MSSAKAVRPTPGAPAIASTVPLRRPPLNMRSSDENPVAVAGESAPSRVVTSTCMALRATPAAPPDFGRFSELTPRG
jgi:hypothetical protein